MSTDPLVEAFEGFDVGPVTWADAATLRQRGDRRRRRRRAAYSGAVVTTAAVTVAAVLAVGPYPGSTSVSTGGVRTPAGAKCAGAPPGCGAGPGRAAQLASGHWALIRSAPLRRRQGAAVAWTGSQLVVWGGATGPASSGVAADGAVWDQATGRWHQMAPSPLSGREGATAVWDGREVLIWGGDGPAAGRALADGAAYDPATNTWTRLPRSPLGARTQATGIWTGTEAVFVGGVTTGLTTRNGLEQAIPLTAAAYDPATGRWAALPSFPPSPLAGAKPVGLTAAWTGTRLYAWTTYMASAGGSIREAQRSAAWAPGQRHWRTLPAPPVPTYGAAATWTGHDVVLAGGTRCLPMMKCLGITEPWDATFAPATERWGRLPTTTVIAAAPLTWTGAALVGFDEDTTAGNSAGRTFSRPGDGAATGPGRTGWLTLPRCPLGVLAGATIVWAGRQLLVWGGAGNAFHGSVAGAVLVPGEPQRRVVIGPARHTLPPTS